jgi:hypothetical protein
MAACSKRRVLTKSLLGFCKLVTGACRDQSAAHASEPVMFSLGDGLKFGLNPDSGIYQSRRDIVARAVHL